MNKNLLSKLFSLYIPLLDKEGLGPLADCICNRARVVVNPLSIKIIILALICSLTININSFAAPSSTISHYAQKELPFKPNDIEQGFYRQIRDFAKLRNYKIDLDWHLSIAAIIYSKEISKKKSLMTQNLLDYTLFQGGSIEANVFPYVIKFSQEKQFSKSLPEIFRTFNEQKATHCGIGFSYNERENKYYLVILGTSKKVNIAPFPKRSTEQKTINLSGNLIDNFTNLKIYITTPKNQVVTMLPETSAKKFQAPITFKHGAGKYQLEIVGDTDLGPEVLALFPVYVGITPPEKPKKEQWQDPKVYQSAFATEKYLFRLINKERKKAELNELSLSPKVSDVARQHSQQMINQDFFAHISPIDGQDFAQRLEKNTEIAATLTGENIAFNDTIKGAHNNLMASPAHRSNILNPDFTDVGLGIAFKADYQGNRYYYITEDFFSQLKDIDVENFQEIILTKINKKRQELNLSALALNKNLSSVAKIHANDMAGKDDLNFKTDGKHLFQKVQEAKIKFKYLSMNIFAFNDLGYKKYLNSPEVADRKFKELGIGLVQKNSKKFGRKAIWLTLVFSE